MTDTAIRNTDLKHMLIERRREMRRDVHGRISGGRRRTDQPKEVEDDLEHSDADVQEDIELTLIQMRAETLTRIDEALVQLDAGQYGFCVECEGEIAGPRLRALPFAVRCQACQEKRERQEGHARQLAGRRGSFSLFRLWSVPEGGGCAPSAGRQRAFGFLSRAGRRSTASC